MPDVLPPLTLQDVYRLTLEVRADVKALRDMVQNQSALLVLLHQDVALLNADLCAADDCLES